MRRIPIALAFFLTACASVATSPVPAPAGSQPAAVSVVDRLFCGLAIPGGGAVTEAEIETFLDEVVEPRFPEGFTVWRARGRWRGGSEDTMIVELIHPKQARLDLAVREIAEEYRRRFRQEAVLRVTLPAEVHFFSE
ncbi:MAG TPA: DUF3574 domain-containing protein [Thermoanaerobaculia bacterium]|nr:DUF3574 domain-containing protein [Thermoanaerobaculia bacterium]